jgi:hypothetical protein
VAICAIGCALLLSLFLWSSVIAAPSSRNALAPLTDIARSIDFSAKGGNWNGASQQHQELAKQWAALRPDLTAGIRVTAQAQSIDASIKWLQTSIGRRDAGNVHRATLTITKAIHEIQEMPAARR